MRQNERLSIEELGAIAAQHPSLETREIASEQLINYWIEEIDPFKILKFMKENCLSENTREIARLGLDKIVEKTVQYTFSRSFIPMWNQTGHLMKIASSKDMPKHLRDIARKGMIDYWVKEGEFDEILSYFRSMSISLPNSLYGSLEKAVENRINNAKKFLVPISFEQKSRGVRLPSHLEKRLEETNEDIFLKRIQRSYEEGDMESLKSYFSKSKIASTKEFALKLGIEVSTHKKDLGELFYIMASQDVPMDLRESAAEDFVTICRYDGNYKSLQELRDREDNLYEIPPSFKKMAGEAVENAVRYALRPQVRGRETSKIFLDIFRDESLPMELRTLARQMEVEYIQKLAEGMR